MISFIPICLMLKYVRWPYSRLCIVWVIRSNVWILDYLVDMKPGVSKNYVTTQECMKHCSIFNCVSNTGYPGHFASAYYCRKKHSRTFLIFHSNVFFAHLSIGIRIHSKTTHVPNSMFLRSKIPDIVIDAN